MSLNDTFNRTAETAQPYVHTAALDSVRLPEPAAPLPDWTGEIAGPTEPAESPAAPHAVSHWAALLAYRTPLQEHSLSCDGKAAAVLTALGIMFTIVARYSHVISDSVSRDPILGKLLLLLIGAFGVLGVLAVVQSFRTIIPRFPPAPRSLAFFGDILRLTRSEYIAEVEAMSDEEAVKHILNFNHTLSLIVVEKFGHVNLCLRMFEFASFSWLGAVLVLTLRAVMIG